MVGRAAFRPGAMLAGLLILAPGPASAELSGAPRLRAVYDAILDARFDEVHTLLAGTCPPAPGEACQALAAVSAWWQVLLDPDNPALDRQLNELASTAIAASEAWTRRDPASAEAWFYLAGAHAPLVEWRVLRGRRIAAARESSTIRDALERALQLDPTLEDAHFGIGLYRYYADVAPTYAKVFRWILRLPGGDREQGLREMREARDRGQLLTGEADYQLLLIDLWYEHQPDAARDLLRSLDARYPRNPLFLERLADVERVYFHDRDASAAVWQQLLDRAEAGSVYDAPEIAARARRRLERSLTSDRRRNFF